MPESPFLFPGREQEDFKKSLPMRIADYIVVQIFQGQYKPGERLKEEELAAMFETSRAPVREALYLLQINGLVERLPRRGAIVRSYAEKEVRDLYEVRLALENLAMDRIAERWQEEWEAEFHPILERMAQAAEAGDAKTYARHNADFHWLLMRLAGSDILWNLYRQTTYPLNTLTRLSTRTKEDLFRSTGEHRAIVEAMREHNFREAKALLSQNVQHGLERVLRVRF
ncbi:GntR family transcriptional regulator [Kyrpidia sp.]|uniref:GntR family transcriptional regulator n=1 Tax=Kyrpidia sp. TaxID=2073077 RepID=UPI002588D027|nr:GntR family transcriptional regulator [Kyrpidia sp.]MCL6575011.1 GntR family transcriptional regulator [Kyrpidia sp.]